MNDDVLYIVIPAYNEQANVASVVNDWYPVVERTGSAESRLVVVNDGSTDDTERILKELAEHLPLLDPVTKENGGHGAAVLFGYRRALDAGANWVFQTDSDGQTLPAEFDAFWEGRERWDAVIGVRSNRQDGLARKLVERVLCLVLKHYFGVKLPDANAPFRLMRAEALQRHLNRLPPNYNLPNAVLTAYFVRMGERVSFREVTFRPRQGGKNSINIRRIVGIGWNALADFRRLSRELKAELGER